MDLDKIAKQRRFIEKNETLTTIEMDQIKAHIDQGNQYISDQTSDHNEADIEENEEQTAGEV